MKNLQSPPPWLKNAFKVSSAGLIVVSIAIATREPTRDLSPNKFQGGILDPERHASPSADASLPIDQPSVTPFSGDGTMVVTVLDQSDRGAEGITIHVRGPRSTTLTTDSSGKAKLVGPAGYYSLNIASGCNSVLDIASGSSAEIGIAEGRTGSGTMRVVWRHRYRPWHPAFSSRTPYWPLDEVIDVGFYVADRCNSMQRSPNASFPSFKLRPSTNLEIVEQSTTADANGHGLVRIRCLSPGRASLVSFDPTNPDDEELDLLLEDVTNGGPPDCRGRDH